MSDTIKLTFKDLKNERFQIEANLDETVSQVKEKIQATKGWDASLLKLIYSGKILQDAQPIKTYNIEESGFIVCMVTKGKAPPKATGSGTSSAAAPSTPVKAATPVQTPPPAPVAQSSTAAATAQAVPETPTPAPQAGATQATPAAFNDPSSLAMGSARETAIQQMTEMGFARPDVEAAMRAAFNNPDRAVEYLMTGIPENLQREATPAARPAAPQQQGTTTGTTPAATATPAAAEAEPESDEPINLFDAAAAQRQGSRGTPVGRGAGAAAAAGAAAGAGRGAGGDNTNLDFLRNNPQFQQLRQVVQQNPQMLEPILQQVGTGNPQLAQLIGQNPAAFLRLLSEGMEGEDELGNMLGGAGGGAGGGPPGTMTIPVTEEERDAIERLCQLGFERDLVIQAYFACDKNEEMAANFLFEQPPDRDD